MSKARQQANLSSDGNLFADISNDRVGVGSVVPTHKLHVNGTSKFDDDVRLEGTLAARRVIWDKSENAIELGDYTYAKFGLDDDLTVWSNDTASAINNKTGELRILSGTNVRILKRSDAGLGFAAQVANFNIDGACDFYHNGTKRIETLSTGAKVTGNLEVTGVLTYDDVTSIDSVGIITARDNVKLVTNNKKITFGSGSNLEIYSNGTDGVVNAASGDIKIQKGGSGLLTFKSTGSHFLADVLIADSIIHDGDTNTKIRFPAADQIQFDTGGTNYLKLHRYASNNFTEVGANAHLSLADNGSNSRNIMIGDGDHTSTGQLFLQAGGRSTGYGGAITMYSHSNSTNAGGVYIGKSYNSSGSIIFGNGGVSPSNEYLRIDSDGQIGIGNITPDTWSTGKSITIGTSQATLFGVSDQVNLSGNAYFNSGWKAAATKAGASQIQQALGNIDFKVSGSVTADAAITWIDALRITSTGKVGVGVATPDEKLDIRDGDIILSSSNAGNAHRTSFIEFTGSYARINSVANQGSTGSSNYAAGWNFTTRNYTGSAFETLTPFVIQANGRIGINETNPGTHLHVEQDNAHGSTYYLNSDAAILVDNKNASGKAVIKLEHDAAFVYGGGSSTLIFADRENERLRINASGNVSIASNNYAAGHSSAKLRVGTESGSTQGTVVFGSGDTTIPALTITNWDGSQTSNWSVIQFDNSGWGNFQIGGTAGVDAFSIYDDTLERVRIDSAGKIGINYAASPPSETIHISAATGHSAASISLSHISGGNRYGTRFSSLGSTDSGVSISSFFNSSYVERVRIFGDSNTCNLKLYNQANTDASATCEIQANHDIRDSSKIVFGRENANDWSASWASQHSFLSFHTFNGSSNLGERLRITSDGKIGINETSPGYPVDIAYTNNTVYSSTATIGNAIEIHNKSTTAGTSAGVHMYVTGNGGNAAAVHLNAVHTANGTGDFTLGTRHSAGQHIERVRVTSIGKVSICDTGAGAVGDPFTGVHLKTTGYDIASGNAIKNSTMGGITVQMASNDDKSIGLWFGTNNSHWSGISGQRNNSASTWGTDLRFYTHENATNDLTYSRERMKIGSEGEIWVPNHTFRVSRGTSNPGGAVLYFSGSRGTTNAAFDMFKIYTVHGNTSLKIEMAFHHSGGGVHGSYTRRYYTMNSYDSLNGRGTFQDSNFGGGGGFTLSRASSPNNQYVTVRYNGSSSFHQNFILQGRIEHGQNGSASDLYLVNSNMDSLNQTINY